MRVLVPGIPADVQTTLEETASADEPGEFSRVWTAREHVQEITEMCTEDSTSPCKDADDIPDMDEFASESNIVVADDPVHPHVSRFNDSITNVVGTACEG